MRGYQVYSVVLSFMHWNKHLTEFVHMDSIENKPPCVQYTLKTTWQSRHKQTDWFDYFIRMNSQSLTKRSTNETISRSIKQPTKCTMATVIHAATHLTKCTFTPSQSGILCDIVVKYHMEWHFAMVWGIRIPALVYPIQQTGKQVGWHILQANACPYTHLLEYIS